MFVSQTRTWMAVVTGAAMAAVMLVFMWGMYDRKGLNTAILVGSAAVFAVA